MKKLIIALTVAAFAILSSLPTTAADAKPAAEPKAAAPRSLPFSGKIASLDKVAKTVTVGERVFHVTSTTRFIKDAKPATFEDAKVGEEVGIAYREGEDKKLNLVSLRIGPKPAVVPKKETPAK